jgi:hypothetical protein
MTNQNEVLAAYAVFFKNWQVKLLGAKPTTEQLDQYHKLGARHGKQCLAGAMALRPDGVTGSEIVIACGAPQLNKMRGLIADAFVKRLPDGGSRNGHQVYKLVLTPKGLKRVETNTAKAAALEAAGKATSEAKPKGKGKSPAVKKATGTPRKPKVVKVPETVEPTTSHTGGEHDMGADTANTEA